MKYGRRQEPIEAYQYQDTYFFDAPHWVREAYQERTLVEGERNVLLIRTPDPAGLYAVNRGDYLVCQDGHIYSVSKFLFEIMYEPTVEEDEAFQKNEVYAALLEYQIEDRAQLTEKELLGEYGVSGDTPPIVTRIQEFDGSETVFWHDKQLLYDSKVIWKIESNGLLATNNSGKTWRRYGYLD